MIRIVTAIILGAAALAAIWWLPAYLFDVIVTAAIVGSLYEFSRMMFADQAEVWFTTVLGAALAVVAIFVWPHDFLLLPLLSAAFFVSACFFMWRTKELPGVAYRLGAATTALVYLVVGLSFWAWLRHLPMGKVWVLLAIVPSCLCDTFAYLSGKAVGRHKLAPLVSPNKTVEGFIGALLGSLVGVFAVYFVLLHSGGLWVWWHMLIIAAVIWILSPMGDLVESLMKRSAQIKDSGTIIPGHGGIMDRLDALTFTGVFMFIYAKYILLS